MHHIKFPPSTDLWVCKHGYSYPDICPECQPKVIISLWYHVPIIGWFMCVRNHGIYESPSPHSDGSYWCTVCKKER